MASILFAKDLCIIKKGSVLLEIPEFHIEEGEVLSIIGPNGAGKTTLLLTLASLIKKDRGELHFRGKKIGVDCPLLEYRRRISMVFQEPLLFDTTVFGNVASGLRFRGMKKKEIERIVKRHLELFRIDHLERRDAKTLSAGEAQRTSLARAFAVDPDILFLDEPFSSLDPQTKESLIADFGEIVRELKKTVIFATHDRFEALRLSDRIAVMNRGKIVQVGTSHEVMNYPKDEFVASFVGVETILEGTVFDRSDGLLKITVSGKKIEAVGNLNVGDKAVLFIRPENVTLSKGFDSSNTSARNRFEGKVKKISSLGLFEKVSVDCGFPLVAYVTGSSLKDLLLKEGDSVFVSFKATAVKLLKKA